MIPYSIALDREKGSVGAAVLGPLDRKRHQREWSVMSRDRLLDPS